MGGGKLPPRQKMIGMMYLVLTALLAMNVSKDILDAFILINKGIETTTSTFQDKNAYIYTKFAAAAVEAPEKVGPWKKRADEVQKLANEMYDHLAKLKITLIKETDKVTQEIADTLPLGRVSSKDNYDIPTLIMGLADPSKPTIYPGFEEFSAVKLEEKIDAYREGLINIVPKDYHQVFVPAIGLTTDEVINADGGKEPWTVGTFYHVPLAACVTMVSKLQADVRNAEAEALKLLFENIDAAGVSFNKVDGLGVMEKGFILKGDTIRAKIFTAAYDDTQYPEIFIGDYDSTTFAEQSKTENYDIEKLMKGTKVEKLTEVVPGQTWAQLPAEKVSGGRGNLAMPTSAVGIYELKGLIKIKTSKGERVYPYKTQYEVGTPSTTIAATKMNVFYIGVPNPVSISAPVPQDKITATGLGISKSGKEGWVVKPSKSSGKSGKITVFADIDGVKTKMGEAEFRIKKIPDPTPYVAGKTGATTIPRAQLKAATRVIAKMENFDFDVTPTVQSFMFSTVGSDGLLKEIRGNGASFTNEMSTLIDKAKKSQKIYIEQITVSMPDGTKRVLPPVSLKVI